MANADNKNRYINTINNVYNVDKTIGGTNQAVISSDYNLINTLLNDSSIIAKLSVPGGIWSDDLIIKNIKSHNDLQSNSVNHELNIGDSNDTINIGFSNYILGAGNVNAFAVFNEPNASIIIGSVNTNTFITNASNLYLNASTHVEITTPFYAINSHSNIDYSSFRVDIDGHVGIGLNNLSNAAAWLHISRDNTNDMFIVNNTTTNTTPFIIKNDGKIGIATSEPEYNVDFGSEGTSFGNHGAGIAIRDIFYLKQNNMNKISYGMGTMLYQTFSSDVCTTGFEMKWDEQNVINLTDPETYSIRISGRFHVTKQGGETAFRRFEIAVNPKNNTNSTPAEIAILETIVFGHSDFIHIGLEAVRSSDSSVKINILWKNNKNDIGQNKSKSYLDLDICSPEIIGNLIFTSNNLINTTPI
jgi:hypothetical protein